MAIILGIESTAHTFGIGVVSNGKVLSNVKNSFTSDSGGMIPSEVAKIHERNKEEIYSKSILEAGISEKDIEAIAFSCGPGLAPCLLVGMKFAKEISLRLNVPIIGVNHCVAHLEVGRVTGAKDPVMLYASGANTQIIAYESGKYRVFGETLDLGVGNFIDGIARHSKLGFPGGPKIQEIAKKGKNFVDLPYSVKGMDISLSGIQTKIKRILDGKEYSMEDVFYSMQEVVFAMLVEVSERAAAHTCKKELLLGGGVACNSRLQEMGKIMCEERGIGFFCPEKSLLVDNAAMIAFLGEIVFNFYEGKIQKNKGVSKEDSLEFRKQFNFFYPDELDMVNIFPRQRTDEVDVVWRE